MYDELVKALRETDFSDGCPCEVQAMCKDADCVIIQAADAIEELQDKVNRAIGFYASTEIAEAIRRLDSCMPNVYDPAWQKAHKEMGFISPLADIYEALGVYDEEAKT